MSKIKTDSMELTTGKSLRQVAAGLQEAAYACKAQVDEIGQNALDKFSDAADIQVVLSGNLGFFGGLKHFRSGSANNIWGVQVFVTDLGDRRHIELIALGESVFAGGFGNGAGVLNMGASVEQRDKIANYLV